MKRNTLLAAIVTLGVSLVFLTGCGLSKMTEPFQDAAIESRNTDPATVGTMPDGFSNFASKCDGPNRVYVVFKNDNPYGSISVVKDDPRCGPQ